MAAALDVRIAGPGLDTTRRLAPGDAPLTLGRDSDCAVRLPDPERSVSRRHLDIWNEAGDLHFLVVSSVNGVEMPFGEAPPGARGVLPAGQVLKVAAYSVTAQPVPATGDAPDADPWAALDQQSARADEPTIAGTADADPFGDWGFETAFGMELPKVTAPAPVAAAPARAPDAGAAAFLRGAGFDAAEIGPLSEGELEAIGQLARTMALAWLRLQRETAAANAVHRHEDRTLLAPRERNPLEDVSLTEAEALRYLFGGRTASTGSIAPRRAMEGLVAGLVHHQRAAAAATRAAVEGTLREFDPDALKGELLEGGAKLFESARAWDAFARHYTAQDLQAWTTRMLDKHFTEAYVRALHAADSTPRGGPRQERP